VLCPSQTPIDPAIFSIGDIGEWFEPLLGGRMLRVNEFHFYELAIKVHGLTELSSPVRFSESWLQLWYARESVKEIHQQRALSFSVPAASRLYSAITSVVPETMEQVFAAWSERVKPENNEILAYWISEISEAAKEFETVLRTECQMMDTYFVSKKGTHSTRDLVEKAHHQIPEPSRNKLPDQAKFDFDQAGRCMAFDVPTAAAFHLLRGTEKVLVDYYDVAVPGLKKASRKMRNWGVYIKLIRDHAGDPSAISVVDHIRDAYRNPVTHPEENYTDERVQVLFGLCVSAVVLLIQATEALESKGSSLNFPVSGTLAVS